jgi:subtilase family serine protease
MGGGLRPGFARPPLHLNLTPHDATSNYGPYSPAQVRHAYGVDLLLAAGATGSGQKIGIVDAYGDPSIQTDLNNFCSYYGIPSTTVQILYSQGKPKSGNSGWALETALDVEWAHVIAPNATIVLSVAKSASTSDLLGAVDAAVAAGATVISMSWGAQESSGVTAYDSHFKAPGVTYVASSGDSGELAAPFEVEWPASSPFVVGVGGTSLYLDASGNRASETAWSGSGGGLSSVYGEPACQNGWQSLGTRCVPDVSYLADPNTGVGVAYGRYLYEVGGTSVGAPQWAALIALANSVRMSGAVGGNADIYSVAGTPPGMLDPTRFFDITVGNNGGDPDDLAGTGYDLVTGLGSPAAVGLVNALAPQTPDFSVSVTPSSQTVPPGQVSYTVTIAPLNEFNGEVDFTVSGLPSDASANDSLPPVSGGSGSSTLTFTTSTTGTYTITITGTSGTLTHTATVTLVVATPDFSLSATPASQTVQHGKSTTYRVNVTPSGGFSGTVALSASGLPTGATATFSPASVNKSGSSTMTVKTGNKTPSGSYTLTITGNSTSPALTHTTTVSLTVN